MPLCRTTQAIYPSELCDLPSLLTKEPHSSSKADVQPGGELDFSPLLVIPPPSHHSTFHTHFSRVPARAAFEHQLPLTTLSPLPLPQDDMHRVIDQQLMDKHPKEWSQLAYSFSSGSGAKRSARPSPVFRPEQQGDEPTAAEGNRLFSFFKKN